jgi:hypothetical protein
MGHDAIRGAGRDAWDTANQQHSRSGKAPPRSGALTNANAVICSVKNGNIGCEVVRLLGAHVVLVALLIVWRLT